MMIMIEIWIFSRMIMTDSWIFTRMIMTDSWIFTRVIMTDSWIFTRMIMTESRIFTMIIMTESWIFSMMIMTNLQKLVSWCWLSWTCWPEPGRLLPRVPSGLGILVVHIQCILVIANLSKTYFAIFLYCRHFRKMHIFLLII